MINKLKNITTRILVSMVLLLIPAESSTQNIPLGHFSVKEGLSNSFVNCLIQDRTGFIWFGTDDGLNRFDGYEVKVFRSNPTDNSSISENIIWALWEDNSGKLWIGTKTGGLNKYDPSSGKFEHWHLDSTSAEEINITYIYEDSRNNIWIGTYRNGLYRFNPSQNKFEHYYNTPGNSKILSENFITSIIEDNNSNIWIATYGGLDKFVQESSGRKFKQVFDNSKNPIWYLAKSSFFENSIWIGALNGLIKFDVEAGSFTQITLLESKGMQFGLSVSSLAEEISFGEKFLWVGTFGGLVRLNLTTGYNERFFHNKDENTGLVSNQIHDIILDRSGVVWIASENGLSYYSQKHSKFNSVVPAISYLKNNPALLNNNVRAITQTNENLIWFGTDVGLIGIRNGKTILNSDLKSLNVWSLFSGKNDKLWIGTFGQGFKELNTKTNGLKTWKVDNPDFNSASFDYVKAVIEDSDGLIWIGFWGGGLARLDPRTSRIEHWRNEKNNPASLCYNDVWVLSSDSKERIWIGTNGGGLNLYQGEKQNNFYNWNTNEKSKHKLSSNNLYTICESIAGNKQNDKTILWIGTANGLNKFVISNDTGSNDGSKLNVEIKYYTVEDGLTDNAIESVLEDESGNLWIGTSTGISFFNIKDERFTNYTTADGLSGSSFNSSAALKTSDGIMLFGCTNGLNYFNPERIKQSTFSPPVVITDFQILNQPKSKTTNSQFSADVFNSGDVDLSYNQNDFSFQFASLDYNAPEMSQYAYYMVGFDDDWIYSGKRRFVTYTNLDPGEYIFRVKATNSDGMWSEDVAEIFIVINPPFWATWWAYTIYVMALIGVLTFIRATEIKRRKKKEEERLRREREAALLREAELRAKNIEQEKELEKQKIRNRIAQDLHDEIGSNLSSISLISELIQNDEKINQDASEKIKRIHKVARGSTQAIRDIV